MLNKGVSKQRDRKPSISLGRRAVHALTEAVSSVSALLQMPNDKPHMQKGKSSYFCNTSVGKHQQVLTLWAGLYIRLADCSSARGDATVYQDSISNTWSLKTTMSQKPHL